MTITRRITITYEARDAQAAAAFENSVEYLVAAYPEVMTRLGVSGLAFSAEPVIPPPEPLVDPLPPSHGRVLRGD